MTERIAVFDDVFFNRTIIDRPKDASVEGDGVGRDATALVPCFVTFHDVRGDAVEHDVFVIAEFLETIDVRVLPFCFSLAMMLSMKLKREYSCA